MTMLAAQGLSFRHEGAAILEDVSLTARAGEATVLLGPSGSGKTTLLWLLAGLHRPWAGHVELRDEAGVPQGGLDRARLGMVFQDSALWDHLTVADHLHVVMTRCGLDRAGRRRRVEQVLQQMQLAGLRRRRPAQLSGGEQRRLAIARALAPEPQWLLLDEPLAHLDGPARAELFGLLRDALMKARAGIVLATHNAAEAMQLADRVALLLNGHVVQFGTPEDVYDHPERVEVARMLGPASLLRGCADGGRLTVDGLVVLRGLDPAVSGPRELILRAEHVRFEPANGGSAIVRRCGFAAPGYLVTVDIAGQEVQTRNAWPFREGLEGELELVRHKEAQTYGTTDPRQEKRNENHDLV